MAALEGTTVSFETTAVELTEDELDKIEEHLRRVYSPQFAELVIEGIYNEKAEFETTFEVTRKTVVVVTVNQR